MIRFPAPYLSLRKAILLAVVFLAGGLAVSAQTRSPLPPPQGYVNDYAGVLDAGTKQRMEAILQSLKEKGDIEFAVVTVKTTGDQDIFDYSLAVARGWGIGSKEGEKNGLLLLVAVDDRKYFIQVSDHLEGDLPDGLTGEIGRRMQGPFRRGDYSSGLMAAVQTFISTLQEKRGFTIGDVDRQQAYREPERTSRRRSAGLSPCALVFIGLAVLIFLLVSRGKRGKGSGGGGCFNLLFLGSLLSSGSGRSGGSFSSGWGGGGFGGSGGGSSGGFGGFGGGGSFGGGGAGGSW